MGALAIKLAKQQNSVVLYLEGDLDSISVPSAREAFLKMADDYGNLILDFKNLNYISSAGLRALMELQKKINKKGGSLRICHVKDAIMEVLEMTGFRSILTFA